MNVGDLVWCGCCVGVIREFLNDEIVAVLLSGGEFNYHKDDLQKLTYHEQCIHWFKNKTHQEIPTNIEPISETRQNNLDGTFSDIVVFRREDVSPRQVASLLHNESDFFEATAIQVREDTVEVITTSKG